MVRDVHVITRDTFSRISKIWVDRGTSVGDADQRRRVLRVLIMPGNELVGSRTLQAAFITAAAVASRCFPHALVAADAEALARAASPFRPELSLRDELLALGVPVTRDLNQSKQQRLLFGTVPAEEGDLQITFDGWIARVGPSEASCRLPERERMPIAGVLAGAQAVAELFFRMAGIHPEAATRIVARSLWRPDLDSCDPEAVGPRLEQLPSEYWISGLGHLGQAFCWVIGLLPFAFRPGVKIVLNDFDAVVEANVETGLLTRVSDVGRLKTRVVASWLEERRFATRLVERAFDEHMRRQRDDPRLALFGFDGTGPRWAIEAPGFGHVIDCGVGGTSDNFDAIATSTFPHPSLSAASVWKEDDPEDRFNRARRLADGNEFYREYARQHRCGEIELAGASVAVPFVGAAAASFALAEAARAVNGGVRIGSGVIRLASMSSDGFRLVPSGYDAAHAPAIRAQPTS
jgi:hypothetical protein